MFVRVTVNGERFELSTARVNDAAGWNKDVGRASGNRQEAKSLNSFLDVYQSQIFDAQRELLSRGNALLPKLFATRYWALKKKARRWWRCIAIILSRSKSLLGKNTLLGH